MLTVPRVAPAAQAAPRAELSIASVDSGRREAFVTLPSGAVFTCPARRARVLATLVMGALASPSLVAVVQFAVDTAAAKQDLIGFVNDKGRLLALEPGDWQERGQYAATLTTRVSMFADRRHIALERSAALHTAGWHRESWTDYLRADDATLMDAPQRPILAGTFQHALLGRRAALAAMLGPPPIDVPQLLLEAARNAGSPLTGEAIRV